MSDERPGQAGFEVIEHTADVGLRVWGSTLNDLFTQAALGLFSLLVDQSRVVAVDERRVVVSANDLEEALVAWLQELLYLYEMQGFVSCEVDIAKVEADGVEGKVRGEPFDPERHEAQTDIKAATYHNLEIRPQRLENGAERWECTIILDT